MIQKHLLHIGLPHTATSWLWQQVRSNFDGTFIKEPKTLFNEQDIVEYMLPYADTKISANFNVDQYQHDSGIVKYLSDIATHISISLRNPHEILESRTRRGLHDGGPMEIIEHFRLAEYARICKRWDGTKPFKVLMYDDLLQDAQTYLNDYCAFAGITVASCQTKRVNVSDQSIAIDIPNDCRTLLNNGIKEFEDYIQRDLSHWLR